jgi:hypothetical protein
MAKYGIDKVRGGSYVQVDLSDFHVDALKMEMWSASDSCTQCGRKGHFVKNCKATTDISGQKIESEESDDYWGCSYCVRTFSTAFGCGVHEKSCKSKVKVTPAKKGGSCYRCGRSGHYSPDCFARTHTMGYTLDSDCESDEDSD